MIERVDYIEPITRQRQGLADLLVTLDLASGRAEASRLIALGAVSIDGELINDVFAGLPAPSSFVLRVGLKDQLIVHKIHPQDAGGS